MPRLTRQQLLEVFRVTRTRLHSLKLTSYYLDHAIARLEAERSLKRDPYAWIDPWENS